MIFNGRLKIQILPLFLFFLEVLSNGQNANILAYLDRKPRFLVDFKRSTDRFIKAISLPTLNSFKFASQRPCHSRSIQMLIFLRSGKQIFWCYSPQIAAIRRI